MSEVTAKPLDPDMPDAVSKAGDPVPVIVSKLAGRIKTMELHDRGALAGLRRLNPPTQMASPAFYALLAEAAPRVLDDRRDDADREQAAWAMVAAGMAILAPRHHVPGRPLGAVLAEAGLHEARLEQFLRARGERLWPTLRRLCRFLAAQAEPAFDWGQLAQLLLAEARRQDDRAERLRRLIAADFYRARARSDRQTEDRQTETEERT